MKEKHKIDGNLWLLFLPQQIIPSDDEEGIPEAAFLKSLSTKEKKKLLK